MTDEERELILKWIRNVKSAQRAHYEAATYAERMHYRLGIPVVALSTIVGASVFATLEESPFSWVRVLVGAVSILAAVLASVQTFLRYSERAVKHREAGVKYGTLQREIERVAAFPPEDKKELRDWVDSFRQRWAGLAQESPVVPKHIWDRVVVRIEAEERRSKMKKSLTGDSDKDEKPKS